MKPLSPISAAAIGVAALAAGLWIGDAGLLPTRKPPALDRAAVTAIALEAVARNPEAVQGIVKDTFAKNPDFIKQALSDLLKSMVNPSPAASAQRPAPAPDRTAAIKANAKDIFSSPRGVTLGNRDGDVTLVEFFDYNCGFCKRALSDKLDLLKTDPKLKIVLKEFPVLGPGSVEAAQVAVAVRMQDPGGAKYLEFHQKLLGGRGQANKASALAAAKDAGLDVARIEQDLDDSEIKAALDEGRKLANLLGINGTPTYVIGDQVVVGAVGVATLSEKINAARK